MHDTSEELKSVYFLPVLLYGNLLKGLEILWGNSATEGVYGRTSWGEGRVTKALEDYLFLPLHLTTSSSSLLLV